MIVFFSKNQVPIRLAQERWTHIVRRHPEMENQKERVEETVSNPEFIQEGDFEELLAIRSYSGISFTPKYLVVVYKEINSQDGFVLTAYFTNAPSKRRKVLWTR